MGGHYIPYASFGTGKKRQVPVPVFCNHLVWNKEKVCSPEACKWVPQVEKIRNSCSEELDVLTGGLGTTPGNFTLSLLWKSKWKHVYNKNMRFFFHR